MINYQLNLKPSGWKKWKHVRTFLPNAIRGVPYAPFPPSYLPASKFWVQGIAIHCDSLIPPWSGFLDAYGSFSMGGGLSGTLMGALNGIDVVNKLMGQPTSISWRLGGNPPPTCGYCIGDLYKENVYFYLDVVRAAPSLLTSTMYSDVFHRCRLKRIYVHHGEVRTYIQKSGDITEGNLLLDIDSQISNTAIDILPVSGTIKITKKATVAKDGTLSIPPIITLTIIAVKSNFSFDVSSDTPTIFPEAGDFYEFEKPLCIEDPLLISGIWLGKESEVNGITATSGFDAHITSYNSPYESVQCSGLYVFKNTVGNVVSISVTAPLTTSDNGEWYWKTKGKTSDVFLDDPYRYKEIYTASNSNTSSTTTTTLIEGTTLIVTEVEKFKEATEADIGTYFSLPTSQYVRIEIDKAGYASRQNWHSPILKREWVKQGGKYFKILNQPSGNVIDVSLKDVTEMFDFDVDGAMSIFNQYSWMITEHYMFDESRGIFEGTISSAVYDKATDITTVTINPKTSSLGTFAKGNQMYNPPYLNNVNSFFNRYTLNATSSVISPSMVVLYTKYDKWKFIYNNNEYAIDKFNIASPFPTENTSPYTINLTCYGNVSGNIKTGYVSFGERYKKFINLSNSGSLLYDVTEGIDQNDNPAICLDADWISSPIVLDVPKETIVGVCGGRYFGMPHTKDFVTSENGEDLFVTTPYGAIGLGSLYCKMVQEDNVVFNDPYTNKLTIRHAALGFKDYPQKSEVVMGTGEKKLLNGTSTLTLDSLKERVKSISFKAETADNKNIMFGIKNTNNIYGVVNSGKGDVDLQTLRIQGICSNSVSSTTISANDYIYENRIASPVYVPCRSCNINYKTYDTVDIGIPTTDSPIIPIGGGISDVTIEYIKENQTIENNGLSDMFLTYCGEKIIIYGAYVPPFSVDGVEYNSGNNKWYTSNGVFIVGSGSHGLRWECPSFMNPLPNIKPDAYPDIEATDIKYPLLVLPDCDYMGGILDPSTQLLSIFIRSYKDGKEYIGCLQVAYNSLPYKLKKGNLIDTDKKISDFLVRPLFIDMNNSAGMVTDTGVIDNYTRIIGVGGTNALIPISDAINVISPFIMQDGTVGLLYDSNMGINLLYSRGGNYWRSTPYILSRNSHSPLYIEDGLIAYITPLGIEVKLNIDNLLYATMAHGDSEGISASDSEALQRAIDSNPKVLIGSGQLDAQRLTGYKTIEGIYKIFFYDQNNDLSCMESPNMMKWNVAANF
jgi:hypothetical protein